MRKCKKYLWVVAVLILATLAMLFNLEENLEEEFAAVADYTEHSAPSKRISYLDLPLTDRDKANIKQLLEPLATWSLLSLGMNKKEIEQRGYATKDIPILRYLAYVRQEPTLQNYIQKIRRRSKIWTPFQRGFVKGLVGANAKGEIQPYLESFAADTHLNYDQLAAFVDRQDWEAFLSTVLFSK